MDFLKKVGEVVAPPPSSPYKGEGGGGDANPASQAISALQRPPRLHKEGFPEKRLADLHLTLPTPMAAGAYQPCVLVGDMLHISGQLPIKADGSFHAGRVGEGVGEADGAEAARSCALTMLATIKEAIKSLDNVVKVVKVVGFVNCSSDFTTPQVVMDGFSNVMIDVFGDSGRSARSAVGVASLPKGVSVEVEGIVQIKL